MTIAFSEEALLAKSRVFIERGLVARDTSEYELFHTWAALALELLGKAALAHVHPVLVADPTKFRSLLAACGHLDTDEVRSIAAKTVYERLRTMSNRFDRRSEDFCMLMANRRNEELHSGSSPTSDLKQESWVSEYWRVSEVILSICGKSLKEWLGDEEASSASKLIKDASKTFEEAVAAKIRRCAQEFAKRYPAGSSERKKAMEHAENAYWPIALRPEALEFDSHDKSECPACHCLGWLFGFEMGEHRAEPEFDPAMGWVQLVDTLYSSEMFVCPTCRLRLSGRQELDIAGLPEMFTKTEAAEPDYEADYGND